MRKWLPLGALALVMLWSPFVYRELSRESSAVDEPGAAEDWADDAPPPRVNRAVIPKPLTALPKPERAPAAPPSTAPATEPETPPPAAPESEPEGPPAAEPGPEGTPEVTSERPVALLRAAFESETRDALWARAHEALLLATAAKHGFGELPAKDVMCRRSVCRVALRVPASEAEALVQLRAAFSDQVSPIVAVDPMAREADTIGVFLYVTRKGYTLTDLEP